MGNPSNRFDARATHLCAWRRHRRPWLRRHWHKLGLHRLPSKMGALPDRSSSLPSSRCSSLSSWSNASLNEGQRHLHTIMSAGAKGRRRLTLPSGRGCWAMPTRLMARHVYRGTRRKRRPGPAYAHPPSLYRGRHAEVPHRQRRSSNLARHRGHGGKNDRSSSLVPWPSPASTCCARRPGRGAQHAVRINIPGVTLASSSPMLSVRHFLVGFAPSPSGLPASLLGNPIIVGGTAAGLFDVVTRRHRQVPGHGPHDDDGLIAVVLRTHPAAGRRYRPRSCRRQLHRHRAVAYLGAFPLKLDAASSAWSAAISRRNRCHRARPWPRSANHRHVVHLCHHHHERAELRSDGHRPNGIFWPHRSCSSWLPLHGSLQVQVFFYRRHR